MSNLLLKRMESAYAENTIKAYRTDFKVFATWYKNEGLCPLPAEPETICGFITFDMQATQPQLSDGVWLASDESTNWLALRIPPRTKMFF